MTSPDPAVRRSREELHDLLLLAGRDLVVEEGLGNGAEHLTLKRVFDRLESTAGIRVTNASVIGRIWESQEQFQVEVLAAIASGDGSHVSARTFQAAAPVLGEADVKTVEARARTVSELCRVGGQANMDGLRDSRLWAVQMGVRSVVMGRDSDRNRAIRQSFVDSYEPIARYNADAYAALGRVVGYRIRAPFTMDQFTVAVDSLAEGCGLRDRADPQAMRDIGLPTGPGGTIQKWTLFGIGLHALVKAFFELDPAWEPREAGR